MGQRGSGGGGGERGEWKEGESNRQLYWASRLIWEPSNTLDHAPLCKMYNADIYTCTCIIRP